MRRLAAGLTPKIPLLLLDDLKDQCLVRQRAEILERHQIGGLHDQRDVELLRLTPFSVGPKSDHASGGNDDYHAGLLCGSHFALAFRNEDFGNPFEMIFNQPGAAGNRSRKTGGVT